MSGRGKLPADYAIDALSKEAERRAKKMNRPDYSYGKLIADTTREEREQIVDAYRAECKRKRRRGCTHSFFQESDSEGAGD